MLILNKTHSKGVFMQLKMYQVDAFTNQLFQGNSAAVIELTQWLDDSLMFNIAKENNLSETAFYVRQNDGTYHIRWFSPLAEIDFCGHATLASAYILFSSSAQNKLTFFAEAVGEFFVTRDDNGLINMCFSTQPPTVVKDVPSALLNGLGAEPVAVLRNRQAYFAIYENSVQINAMTPDLELLKQLAPYDVVISAPAEQYDFVSRYFWPANGGDEDPVTGSIHCGLIPYWAQRLEKDNFVAYQGSNRGGIIYCKLDNDLVTISGEAILYMTATIEI